MYKLYFNVLNLVQTLFQRTKSCTMTIFQEIEFLYYDYFWVLNRLVILFQSTDFILKYQILCRLCFYVLKLFRLCFYGLKLYRLCFRVLNLVLTRSYGVLILYCLCPTSFNICIINKTLMIHRSITYKKTVEFVW